jgi:GNAT superfamily N-acetyltransferase
MRIVSVEAGALLDAVHADVLTASFPPNELSSVEGLREGIGAGYTSVLAVVDEDGVPRAAAVGDWSAETRVALLSYLAARPGDRSTGLGGRLLSHALATWRDRWQPCLTVAEIEHPSAHEATASFGDPAARVRFYSRFGLRPLDLPYFQPALRPGDSRAYGLMLCVFDTADACRGAEPDTVDGEVLRRWFIEYLAGSEGAVADDTATAALLRTMDRTGGVRVLSFDDLAEVPCSAPPR